jgi:hypothetical protein
MILSNVFLEIEPFGIDDGLEIGIIIFSVILFALSITAYRNTGIKKILFAAAAFALFAIQLLVDTIGDYFGFFEDIADILVVLITFAILVLFFVAIVKKR